MQFCSWYQSEERVPKHDFHNKTTSLPGTWLFSTMQHSSHAMCSLALSGLAMLNARNTSMVTQIHNQWKYTCITGEERHYHILDNLFLSAYSLFSIYFLLLKVIGACINNPSLQYLSKVQVLSNVYLKVLKYKYTCTWLHFWHVSQLHTLQ